MNNFAAEVSVIFFFTILFALLFIWFFSLSKNKQKLLECPRCHSEKNHNIAMSAVCQECAWDEMVATQTIKANNCIGGCM